MGNQPATPAEEPGRHDSELASEVREPAEAHASELPAADELLATIYAELHTIARRQMRRQPQGHTLQATALVNEAWLKLRNRLQDMVADVDRGQMLSLAATAMRTVLVDHARAKNRAKRVPPGSPVPLDDLVLPYKESALDLQSLDEALDRLADIDQRMVRIVELRFFGGLGFEEISRIVGLPVHRVEREWQAARVVLRAELE